MRIAAVGAGVFASLVVSTLVAALLPKISLADRALPSSPAPGGGLITVTAQIGDQRQQLTVLDPQSRVLSVYHIELSTGEVMLKSVRNIHWDLQMTEFNGTSPLPREVRALLDQR